MPLSLLPPPPLLMNVNVGMTGCVGVERMNMTVDVTVGEGVSVGRVGVIVGVKVDVGCAAAVCVEAAFAVCAMKMLTAFGSAVGKGAVNVGAQAMTRMIVTTR